MYKKIPHIIFYGHYKSFDYYKIGGLESFYRRTAAMLSEVDVKVSFVFYGSGSDEFNQVTNRISLRYFKNFRTSLDYIAAEASLVIDNYLLKKHRLSYFLFRVKHRRALNFGHIYTGVPKGVQQKIMFISRKSIPFNGPILSLSHTIRNRLLQLGIESDVMYPSIPAAYCVPTVERKDRLRLTFMGRFDENKGIKEVLSLYQKISQSESAVEMCVSGYFGHGKLKEKELKKLFERIPKLDVQEQTWQKWSSEMDEHVVALLQKTDILILPYHNLQGTMDPPLLVLEGMACGCVVFTTDVGSVKEFYGESEFIFEHSSFVEKAYALMGQILSDREVLEAEQERVAKRVDAFQKNTHSVVDYLLNRSMDV